MNFRFSFAPFTRKIQFESLSCQPKLASWLQLLRQRPLFKLDAGFRRHDDILHAKSQLISPPSHGKQKGSINQLSSKSRRGIIRLFAVLFFAPPLIAWAEPDGFKKVAFDLAQGLKKNPKKLVAVLTLPQANNTMSEGSYVVSDRLASELARDKQLSVLERHHMAQVLSEYRLSETGLVDTKATKRLGQVLGADIIVTGTLIDLNRFQSELNVRGLHAGTGIIMAASRGFIDRVWETPDMLAHAEAQRIRSQKDPLMTLAHNLVKQLAGKKISMGVVAFNYPQGRISTGSDLLSERLVTYLVREGAVLVERRLLESYVGEWALEAAGVVGQSSPKKTRGLLGVDALAVGSLSDLSDEQTRVQVRVIDVASSQVLASDETVCPRIWLDMPRFPNRSLASRPLPGMLAPSPLTARSELRRHRLSDLSSDENKQHYYPSGMPFFPKGGKPIP